MKAFFIFIYCLVFVTFLQAQVSKEIIQAEYFFDADPGEGNGTSISVTPDELVSFSETVLTVGLAEGPHLLNIRVKDIEGEWGAPFKTVVFIEGTFKETKTVKITQTEYFFDTDPGEGNGTAITVSPDVLAHFSETIPTTGISEGPHLLNVRSKGNDNEWSTPFKTVVFVKGPFTTTKNVRVNQAEYFFDTDPGEGSGVALTVQDGNYDEALEEAFKFSLPVLDTGSHVLHVRALGEDGAWSSTFKIVVYVRDRNIPEFDRLVITEAEYFFDTDPGEGSGTAMLVSDGKWDEALESVEANVFTGSLVQGFHVLNVRTKDRSGEWCTPFKTVISVQPKLSSTPTAGQISGNTNFCNGEPTFGIQYTTLVEAGNTYTWDIEGGSILSTTPSGSSVAVGWTPSAPIHQLKLLTCDGSNCADTVFADVVIGTKPTISLVSSEVYLCEDQEVILSVDGVSGNASYSWEKEGFDVANTSSSLDIIVPGDYKVKVDVDGCVGEDSILIESKASPSVQVIVLGGSEFCEDGTTRLIAPETGSVTYSWEKDGVAITGENSNELVVSELGEYVLKASNTDCISSSDFVAINVIPLGDATVTSNTGAFSICSGNDITLSVQETPDVSYQWFKDDVAVNTGTTNELNVNAGAMYSLQFINSFCSRTTPALDVVETETPSPVISNESLLFFCDNDSVKLTSNVETDVNYQWLLNSTPILGAMDPLDFYANKAGDFQVEADRNGCKALSNVLSALVQPSPDIPEISVPMLGELMSTTANSYKWFLDGAVISGETAQNISVTETGTYVVKVGDVSNFCFAESEPLVAGFDVVALFDSEKTTNDLSLYPSVASSIIYFNRELENVTVLDVRGNVLLKKVERLRELEVTNLPAGKYVVLTDLGIGKFIRE